MRTGIASHSVGVNDCASPAFFQTVKFSMAFFSTQKQSPARDPGFHLSVGFTLFYLGLIVLIPFVGGLC